MLRGRIRAQNSCPRIDVGVMDVHFGGETSYWKLSNSSKYLLAEGACGKQHYASSAHRLLLNLGANVRYYNGIAKA